MALGTAICKCRFQKALAAINLKAYRASISYIVLIVCINSLFVYLPSMTIHGQVFAWGDVLVGSVYIVRDFAQREIKHYVLFAMLIGAALSYVLVDKALALASLTAFSLGELIDWAIYTYTRRPLSERLLLSSIISTPVDSLVFLAMLQMLNPLGLSILMGAKLVGILLVWLSWRLKKA